MNLELHWIDISIIALYVIGTVIIGFWISKRASKNMENYFLGGNSIPWYYLGLSNASGMFDISGTMWMVYLLFIYGLKSVWIPWLWPVFNQIFLMIFLSVWLRRSNVMTGAEWIKFRFGNGLGAELAHIIVVVFALFNVIGFLAYGFVGIGKFAATFLPFEFFSDPSMNANTYGIIITAITTLYVVKGGMFSVVFTEVLQFFIMTIACIAVGVIAMYKVSPDMLEAVTPDGWENIFFSWELNLDWSGIMEAANGKIAEDGWNLFGIFFMLMLFKGYLQSAAGPAPNYDMQRVLSAKTPKEAAKMSGFVNLVLLIPRYMLIAGLTVLALAFFMDELNGMGSEVDFELILPLAIREFLPVGLMGILLAGLLAAFMSTYAATVNAAPAYIVNDIYKKYVNPNASDKLYVRLSYLTSVIVVIIGTAFGFITESLNDLIQWIVAALYGGYTASNLLKWYWWRFNSMGYFWGMVSGIGTAMLLSIPFESAFNLEAGSLLADFWIGLDQLSALEGFLIILGISLMVSILASLFTEPDDEETLKKFYFQVRPWGFWKPIHQKLLADYPGLEANKNFGRDMLNVAVGITWQTALTATGIFLVLKNWTYTSVALGVVLATSFFLKVNWYDKMEDWPEEVKEKESVPTEIIS
ncbi:MAG: Na+:solute symporter [Bacteroidia bacterium]|nr:Na+:solute symporter [Bacteroidia bacterium]